MKKHRICAVAEDSIAEELGIEAGDFLVSINAEEVVDVFDYRFLVCSENIELLIESSDGEEVLLSFEKDEDEDLGLVFETDLMDEVKSCQNKCKFCFIDQLPPNMRKTVYFKDDDWRLSYLYGNYVTLTNMLEEDYARLAKHKLSPINISIHATDPAVRRDILTNKRAGEILEHIRRIIGLGIQINAQIVLCKGLNDGKVLDDTIKALSEFIPNILSLSIVPVGVTKFRNELAQVEVFDKQSAAVVIETVNKWQKFYLEKMDTRFVFAADEFYVVAEEKMPKYEDYEGFPVIDNGVGMLAKFRYELTKRLAEIEESDVAAKYICPVGEIAYDFMANNVKLVNEKFPDIEIDVRKVKNEYFGKTVTVTGLITAEDIIKNLKNVDLKGKIILIADNMLKMDEDIFLDNKTVAQLEAELNSEVQVMPHSDGCAWINLLV